MKKEAYLTNASKTDQINTQKYNDLEWFGV